MATEKRLIDADVLDEILKNFESRYKKACFALSAKAIANARLIVYAMKTVDAVEVVHGRWEAAGFDGHGDYKECCSNCLTWSIGADKLYCPVCGAKMDGDANGI